MSKKGYVVVQIDGMGTAYRSKAFHDIAWKNLKDAGLPDRILWIKSAAQKHNWMDTSRVGVDGSSAGGQNSMRAVLDYPQFYKAAVATAGCHDNRYDKIWWNEMWMGWPVDSSYEQSSNIRDAYKLRRPLLLIVGEKDHNVNPACTYKTIDALNEANKSFDYLIVPNVGHDVGFKRESYYKRLEFFDKYLMNK